MGRKLDISSLQKKVNSRVCSLIDEKNTTELFFSPLSSTSSLPFTLLTTFSPKKKEKIPEQELLRVKTMVV
jgi:hypothetical protein